MKKGIVWWILGGIALVFMIYASFFSDSQHLKGLARAIGAFFPWGR